MHDHRDPHVEPEHPTRRSPSQRNLVKCLHRSRVSVALMVKNRIAALRRQRQITYRQNKQMATSGLIVDS